MTKRQVCKILVILLGLVLTQSTFGQSGAESSAFSYGQAKSKEPQQPFYQYVVKFVCGKSDGQILSRGDYRTAINLHNPHPDSIGYSWKVAVAFPGQVGPVSKFVNAALGPDEALEIDCRQIYQRIEGKPGFLKGFVVIESKVELDVVSVYTAAGATGEVETMDIERVSPRHFAGCPDLVIEKIERPDWDAANHRSVIRATVRNIGTAPANPTFARVIDPTTFQPSGAPYNAIAATGLIAPGAAAAVTFYLPYWVYNPDVILEVTADYKNDLRECDEDNNVKVFEDRG